MALLDTIAVSKRFSATAAVDAVSLSVEAGQQPQQRGLAAAGRPQEREELARRDLQRDSVDRGRRGAGIAFDDLFDNEMRGHAYWPVLMRVQARVRSRSYCGVTGLSKNSRARTSCGG